MRCFLKSHGRNPLLPLDFSMTYRFWNYRWCEPSHQRQIRVRVLRSAIQITPKAGVQRKRKFILERRDDREDRGESFGKKEPPSISASIAEMRSREANDFCTTTVRRTRGLPCEGLAAMHRKNQNLQVWKLAADRSRNFKPTLARHA